MEFVAAAGPIIFELCGFQMTVASPPADDFNFSELDDEDNVALYGGEAKKVLGLPTRQLPNETISMLLWVRDHSSEISDL